MAATSATSATSSASTDGLTVVAEVSTGGVISWSAKTLALHLLSLTWFFCLRFQNMLNSKVGLTFANLMKLTFDQDS
jgi:hypothetical protein